MTFQRDARAQCLKGALLLWFPRGWESRKLVKRNIVLRSLGLTLEVHQYKKTQHLSEAVVVTSRFYQVTLNIYSSYCDLASDLGFLGPPASGHGICTASFSPPSWQDEQSSPYN